MGRSALSSFDPAPDGQHFAYGQSEGGSRLVDATTSASSATGKQLPDVIKWVKFSGIAWTEDGKGFFYGRYPEPPAGKALEAAVRDKKIYYHALGTEQSADRLIYERPDEPSLFIDADTDETGRYLFFFTNKGTSNKNELFVKDLGDPLRRSSTRRCAPLYAGHTAAYDAARRRERHAVSADRSRRAEQEGRRRADRTPRSGELEDDRAGDASTPSSRRGWWPGKLAVNALVDVASDVQFYNLDGTPAGQITPPGLGAISGPFGRFDRPEVFYTFTSPLYPSTVFRFDVATGQSTPFEPPKLHVRPGAVHDRARVLHVEGRHARPDVHHAQEGPEEGRRATRRCCTATAGSTSRRCRRTGSDVPAWLERGGMWATANMRGGGEYGEAWHEAGMLEKKQNVFDDFIAAAEYLVREKLHVAGDARHHGRIERRPAGRRRDGAAARPVRGGAAGGRRDGHAALSQVHRRRGVGDRSTGRRRTRRSSRF